MRCLLVWKAELHAHMHKQSFYLHTITSQAANPIEEGKHGARAKALLIS